MLADKLPPYERVLAQPVDEPREDDECDAARSWQFLTVPDVVASLCRRLGPGGRLGAVRVVGLTLHIVSRAPGSPPPPPSPHHDWS